MRRLIGFAAVLALTVGVGNGVLAQSAAPSGSQLCVTVDGPVPSGGWTPVLLTAAIASGRATLDQVSDCASPPTPSAPSATPIAMHRMSVTVQLRDTSVPSSIAGSTTGCRGLGGYSDFAPGMQILVKDATGKVLAVGTVDSSSRAAVVECDFTGDVSDVPDADLYQIEVGARGGLSFTRADLEARNWHVVLSIGD